jgi:hypothetical protein
MSLLTGYSVTPTTSRALLIGLQMFHHNPYSTRSTFNVFIVQPRNHHVFNVSPGHPSPTQGKTDRHLSDYQSAHGNCTERQSTHRCRRDG